MSINSAEVLKGIEVARAMKEGLIAWNDALKVKGIEPCLAIVRAGERPDDMAYEDSVTRWFGGIGIKVSVFAFPQDIGQQEFEQRFKEINEDESVHGILLFRPLPKTLDEEPIKEIIDPNKDVDCMSAENIAKVFMGDDTGFTPCTPAGVVELLRHYQVSLKGKEIVLIGRSMVVGKPLAMLLLEEHATVTICHSRTEDLPEICRRADIIISAVGVEKIVKGHFIKPGAVVIDVGINLDEDGNMCGDVDFDEVSRIASKITPVPGGTGTVTTSVLAKHVLEAAERFSKQSASL